MTQQQLNKFRKACLANADAFLKAGRKLTKPSERHIAYHLAGLALEEIGKIEIVNMQSVARSKLGDDAGINIDLEDHEKKLFFSFWGVAFGKQLLTKELSQSQHDLARSIHQKRLDTLYISVDNPFSPGSTITKAELDNILGLAEARLRMEKAQGTVRLSGKQFTKKEAEVMDWYFKASSDPMERKYMFSGASNAKLVELGNAKDWVNWLYDESQKRLKEGQEIALTELNRQKPAKTEASKPKWAMKLKIRTESHAIRQKNFTRWNNDVIGIKLHGAKDKHDLIIEIIMPKNIPLQGVWDMGWRISKSFIVALNIATTGFFWWNIDKDTAKYYDEVKDLERPGYAVVPQIAKKLEVNWQELKLVLDEQALTKAMMIYAFTSGLYSNEKTAKPLIRYGTAMALLAKNDIHLRLEGHACSEFFGALKDAVIAFGDQKKGEEINDALRRLIPTGIHQSLDRSIEVEEALKVSAQKGTPLATEVMLTDVLSAKLLFDYYLGQKANAWANARSAKEKKPKPKK